MRGHTEIIMSAAWSPNGSCIASVSHDRTMRIWDPVTGKCVLTNSDHATRLKKLAWSSVGQLASVTEDYTINILNSDTKCSITHEERTKLISCIAWSQNGSRFASGSYSSTIYVWDPFTGDCITTLKDPGTYVHSVAFSEDGKRLFSGSDNIFKLWNIATRDFTPLEGHTKQVNIAAWSKDYRRIASGSSDWTVKIWNPSTLQCLSTLHGHMGEVHTIIWSPDGTRLASAGGYGHWGDGTVRIWNTVTAELISILMVPTSIPTIDSMAWSPDGSRLALGGYDNIVRVWDLSFDSAPSTPGPSTSALEMHNNEANHVSWSLETSYLASVSKDGEIKIWSRITKHCIWTIKMVGTKFLSVAWSPQDPNRFASGSDDGTVKIWDLLARKCMCILEGGLGWVKHISWSPDGNQIAGGGRFSMAVWVVSTGRHIRIDHYDGKIYWSIWSTDGSQLASMDEWRIITLWDVNTGKRIADFDEGSPSCDGLEGARSSGSTFRVESGVIVPDYTSQSRRGKGYGSRRDWITYEGADLLWIPPEFQAQEWSISDNMVAIGCASGRVLMFEFAQDRSGSS
ncbi:hypothetical protein N7467_005988 [Penicillium canescens]|nr:hypothetical protein N7467_005988 [Penicillium canescens]